MYVINPDREQLNSWFKCKRRVGEFLVNEKKMPLIHRSKGYYYFVETEELKNIIKEVPLWMKLFGEII
jgi:hypothetical protein